MGTADRRQRRGHPFPSARDRRRGLSDACRPPRRRRWRRRRRRISRANPFTHRLQSPAPPVQTPAPPAPESAPAPVSSSHGAAAPPVVTPAPVIETPAGGVLAPRSRPAARAGNTPRQRRPPRPPRRRSPSTAPAVIATPSEPPVMVKSEVQAAVAVATGSPLGVQLVTVLVLLGAGFALLPFPRREEPRSFPPRRESNILDMHHEFVDRTPHKDAGRGPADHAADPLLLAGAEPSAAALDRHDQGVFPHRAGTSTS